MVSEIYRPFMKWKGSGIAPAHPRGPQVGVTECILS